MTTSLDSLLVTRTAGHGAHIGLIAEDRAGHRVAWSRERIERVTSALAGRLASLSAGPTVVVVDSDNTLGSALALIAVLRTGLPLLPRAPRQVTASQRREVLDHLAASGHTVLRAGVNEHGVAEVEVEATASPGAAAGDLPDHSVLLHTGGSAGSPKLLVDTAIRRRPLHRPPARLVARLNWRPGQVQLVAGPLDHAAPLTFFVEGVFDGNVIVLLRRFDPQSAVDLIEQWNVRWIQLTPFQMDRLALAVGDRPGALSTVRTLVHTAAPCPERVKRFWIDWLGPDHVFEMYGASEGIGVTIASGTEWLRRPGTVGRGFWTQIRILDERKRPLPAGTVGRVYLRSGAGSRRDRLPVGASAVLDRTPDNFASVGDHGYLDEDGYLYLRPRQLDMINVGGEKVYPAEVERVLLEHPDVLDAIVLGRPDQRFGARPHAIVVARTGAPVTEQELKKHCRTVLPNVKVPATVRFVDELPRTEAGKLRRTVVDAEFGEPTPGSGR